MQHTSCPSHPAKPSNPKYSTEYVRCPWPNARTNKNPCLTDPGFLAHKSQVAAYTHPAYICKNAHSPSHETTTGRHGHLTLAARLPRQKAIRLPGGREVAANGSTKGGKNDHMKARDTPVNALQVCLPPRLGREAPSPIPLHQFYRWLMARSWPFSALPQPAHPHLPAL